jgi:hypothetical protein
MQVIPNKYLKGDEGVLSANKRCSFSRKCKDSIHKPRKQHKQSDTVLSMHKLVSTKLYAKSDSAKRIEIL